MLRRGVPLNDWYVVLPLDPTLENYLDWLETVPETAIEKLRTDKKLDPPLSAEEEATIEAWRQAPGRVIGWKGLDFCEGLAAARWYVVDYYLHGGSQRIKDAVAEVAKLLQTDSQLRAEDATAEPGEGSAALMQPAELREHLGRLGRVLDTDPHFRYGVAVDPVRPNLHPELHLIAATQESIPGDLWLTFKIYQRSAQSLGERPIPIELKFEFEEDSDEHQAFKDWVKYGKPAEAPATFSADLPGGLDRGPMAGRVSLPPQNESTTPYRLRFRVASPDHNPLAEMSFLMRSTRGLDNSGGRIYGADDSGSVEISMLLDGQLRGGTINFTVAPIAGSVAARMTSALDFASQVVAPNILQIAGEFGPFENFSPLGRVEPLVEPALAHIVRALTVIQARVSQPVLVPEFHGDEYEIWRAIYRAAGLIEGKTLVSTWSDYTFTKNADAEIPVGSHWQMILGERLRLRSITGEAELGLVEQHFGSVKIDNVDGNEVRCVPLLDDTVHLMMVDELPAASSTGFTVRCRRLPDPTEQELAASQQ